MFYRTADEERRLPIHDDPDLNAEASINKTDDVVASFRSGPPRSVK